VLPVSRVRWTKSVFIYVFIYLFIYLFTSPSVALTVNTASLRLLLQFQELLSCYASYTGRHCKPINPPHIFTLKLNAYKILAGNQEGKKPLGIHRCRWEDTIRRDLRESEWEIVDWIHLAQDKD
jgi:hypothetical protein